MGSYLKIYIFLNGGPLRITCEIKYSQFIYSQTSQWGKKTRIYQNSFTSAETLHTMFHHKRGRVLEIIFQQSNIQHSNVGFFLTQSLNNWQTTKIKLNTHVRKKSGAKQNWQCTGTGNRHADILSSKQEWFQCFQQRRGLTGNAHIFLHELIHYYRSHFLHMM